MMGEQANYTRCLWPSCVNSSGDPVGVRCGRCPAQAAPDAPSDATLTAVCAELVEALKDALFGLEAAEACLIGWNKTGAPVNVGYIRARADTALSHALPFVGEK